MTSDLCHQTLQVLVHGEGPDVTPVKVLNCDTITQVSGLLALPLLHSSCSSSLIACVCACMCVPQVKEKIIDQVYRNLPYSQRPKVESVALGEWPLHTRSLQAGGGTDDS